ncbi:carboxylesterase/lipase family protein [Streptomyces sp. NPDC057718]|uniref:carboxylesterase/lipase family protein n=1 Tax=Streptomyces sp. NPDC057718 TaxID=3346225 RepID=UPI003679B15B
MTDIRTEFGVVRGEVVDGLHRFRAVPYAAPPFGPLRFEPPAPPEPWDGIRDATTEGVGAPQISPGTNDPWAPLYIPSRTGEDCLTLEIWTPEPGPSRLPVAVHIHGGGYVTGAGFVRGHSGRTFARDGVVHVSINYRLGIEGFLYLGDGHDNLGLRDQLAALEWVRRNIAAFGGDSDRVTILGQSGGGVSIMTHAAMPRSRPLFARAIAQSGSPIASADAETAFGLTKQVAKGLGVQPTAEALRQTSVQRGIDVTRRAVGRFMLRLLTGDERPLYITPFQAVHGTDLLPESPLDNAPAQSTPMLAGTVANETIGFVQALTGVPLLRSVARRGLQRALRLDKAMEQAYRNGPRHLRTRDELLEAAWSDWAFRAPTIHLLERRPAPSWLYEFRWGRELGACHGIELPFMRDDLAATTDLGDPVRAMFADAPQQLADAVHGTFVRFVKDGDPGWNPYEPQKRTTMLFDSHTRAEDDPAGSERTAWGQRW